MCALVAAAAAGGEAQGASPAPLARAVPWDAFTEGRAQDAGEYDAHAARVAAIVQDSTARLREWCVLNDEQHRIQGAGGTPTLTRGRAKRGRPRKNEASNPPVPGMAPGKVQTHRCKHCHAAFASRTSLSTHVRTHTGERPYACKVCKMRFSQSGSRVVHMRTHTGEKPYGCETCGKVFTQSGGLRAHLLTHARVSAAMLAVHGGAATVTVPGPTADTVVPLAHGH